MVQENLMIRRLDQSSAPSIVQPVSAPARAELCRLDLAGSPDRDRRAAIGQFLTPAHLAMFMAGMFRIPAGNIRLLDAGAGAGALTAAFIARICASEPRPNGVTVVACEQDPELASRLRETLAACEDTCRSVGMAFEGVVIEEDFIETAHGALAGGLFAGARIAPFDAAILNPPYRKIRADSPERALLSDLGVEVPNLYAAFVALASSLLVDGGQLVAITPRSFCNGPYFEPFRRHFLGTMSMTRVHLFEGRSEAFVDDSVLQENVVFHAVRTRERPPSVVVTTSASPEADDITVREVSHEELVDPADPRLFLRIRPDELDSGVAGRMERLPATLDDLRLTVSTGRVVDFRARSFLRSDPGQDTAPLIYPSHLAKGAVRWPIPGGRKPNAILMSPDTESSLLPSATYVLVKRFSSKEERRRVVAAVFRPEAAPGARVGFENHLNYFHRDGAGLPDSLSRGLAAFLNSSLVDDFFRQFNGHTQVNATDLRSLRYPPLDALERLGCRVGDGPASQDAIDRFVEEEVLPMAHSGTGRDPLRAKRRVREALAALKALGLPRQQQNERSALVLLALLELDGKTPWSAASAPLCGVTPLMDHVATHFGRKYAPNTRETVRRQTLHQFLQAGLVVQNSDDLNRPTTSKDNVYQVTPPALALLRSFGTAAWEDRLRDCLAQAGSLRVRYAQEREMRRIPVRVAPGTTIHLSPGGQNALVKAILDEFCPRFTPDARAVYVGDAAKKLAYFDAPSMAELGPKIDPHGKMPDVVIYQEPKNWLVLIEAVTAHGPVDPKRRAELKTLFRDSKAGLVFVTAFLDRSTLVRYLRDIAWETEVWVADSPSHLIHFNGERFLGPYDAEMRPSVCSTAVLLDRLLTLHNT